MAAPLLTVTRDDPTRPLVRLIGAGACIGLGIGVPAAAAQRIGRPTHFAQLPELAMELMPGAGDTVTLPRAIGQQRTAALPLTGCRIDAATALDWGLLTALEHAG